MVLDKHTSQRTSLGYLLQILIEEALKISGFPFKSNVLYQKYFIKPDALIPGVPPTHSIHVTATGGDDSFRMKRWRYVDEILQMRSIWGSSFVAINVMFGPLEGYQAGDRKLMVHLFDSEISVHELKNGAYTYQKAIEEINLKGESKINSQNIYSMISDPLIKDTITLISKNLKEAILTTKVTNVLPSDAINLKNLFEVRSRSLEVNPLADVKRAYWKRSMLRFLAVTPELWEEALKLKTNALPPSAVSPRLLKEGLRSKLLTSEKRISSKIKLNEEVGDTLSAGLDLSFLNQLKVKLSSNPRRRFELEDLWDNGSRSMSAVQEVADAIKMGRQSLVDIVKYSISFGGSSLIQHHRAHAIDVLISAIGWSQNRLQDQYKGPGIGVTDPIRNCVPRTEIAQQALKNNPDSISNIASSIVDALWDEVNSLDLSDIQVLVDKYIAYRTYCLVKGSSIDPLEEFIETTVLGNAWTKQEPSVICNHPVVGRLKTKFTFAAKKDDKRMLIKCLFGDTGADHKAEEMEARMRIVRTCSNSWKDSISIFVADGKWSKGHTDALYLGGWDHITSVKDLDALLKTLS